MRRCDRRRKEHRVAVLYPSFFLSFFYLLYFCRVLLFFGELIKQNRQWQHSCELDSESSEAVLPFRCRLFLSIRSVKNARSRGSRIAANVRQFSELMPIFFQFFSVLKINHRFSFSIYLGIILNEFSLVVNWTFCHESKHLSVKQMRELPERQQRRLAVNGRRFRTFCTICWGFFSDREYMFAIGTLETHVFGFILHCSQNWRINQLIKCWFGRKCQMFSSYVGIKHFATRNYLFRLPIC